MSGLIRAILMMALSRVTHTVCRAPGREPVYAEDILSFGMYTNMANFKANGHSEHLGTRYLTCLSDVAEAVEYKDTPTQECIRQLRLLNGPPKLPMSTSTTSQLSSAVYKPSFVLYAEHEIGSEDSQVVALLGEHKSDTAVRPEARTRQCFAQHFVHLASAYEALHTSLGYVWVKTRYSRVLALGPGTFAVEVHQRPSEGVPGIDDPLRRMPPLAANEVAHTPDVFKVFTAIEFLKGFDLFSSLAHDAHPNQHEDRYAGLQPLWDLSHAGLDVLSLLPYNRPLAQLPVPGGGRIGNTYDRVVAPVLSQKKTVHSTRVEDNLVCGALVLGTTSDCEKDDCTALRVDSQTQGTDSFHAEHDENVDDLVPFDCDAESYEEEVLFTRVIREREFTVVTVAPTDMDLMIEEYVAFVRAELKRAIVEYTPALLASE